MDRIIEVKVNGSYLTKDCKNAGVQHEANVTFLRLEFDPSWDGYAKTVTFWDAKRENPVKRTLTTDLLEDILVSTRVYLCPIPGEPLTEAGECTFVIDGYSDGKRMRSISDELFVKEAPFEAEADEPTDPTPSRAEQLQEQIDSILGTIQEDTIAAQEAADAAKASEEAAKASEEGAANSAALAAESEANAKASEDNARESENNAKNSEDNAKTSENAAKDSEERAAESASEASASEENAAQSANTASRSQEKALESEEKAGEYAQSAGDSAADAAYSEAAARASAETAKASEDMAVDSAKLAQSWAYGETGVRADEAVNNAKYWSDRAKNIAGGDFATNADLEAVIGMIVKIQVGGLEPAAGPALWFDTDIQLPSHNMNLNVGSPGAQGELMVCVNERIYPLNNATLNGTPTDKTYDFTVK